MIRLAIDTSTPVQSLALADGPRLLESFRTRRPDGHSATLAAQTVALLARQGLTLPDVASFVVGVGPGGFTGLRLGLAFVRGIAMQTGAMLEPVPSFRGITARIPEGRTIAWAADARKKEVYCALVGSGPTGAMLLAPAVMPLGDFAARVAESGDRDVLWVGDGPSAYPEATASLPGTRATSPELEYPEAVGLLISAIAAGDRRVAPHTVEPVYIRPSEAEIAQQRRRLTGASDAI